MAAAIKALNAKIRANPTLDYFCSTRMCNLDPSECIRSGQNHILPKGSEVKMFLDQNAHYASTNDVSLHDTLQEQLLTRASMSDFWGPASNFGIPIAAVMDTQKDPEIISGRMTLALGGYSGVFMRYAMAVTPKNYLLFGCHFVNFGAQLTQGYRFLNYWNFGGREKLLESRVKMEGSKLGKQAEGLVNQAKDTLSKAGDKVQDGIQKAKGS